MNYFSQTCETGVSRFRRLNPSRLRRLMCGKALPFRNAPYFYFAAMPQRTGARQSRATSIYQLTERQSLIWIADIPVRQRAQHAHCLRTEGPFALRAQADRMSAIRKFPHIGRQSRSCDPKFMLSSEATKRV